MPDSEGDGFRRAGDGRKIEGAKDRGSCRSNNGKKIIFKYIADIKTL